MKEDEIRHAQTAVHYGAAELPPPVKFAMRGMSLAMKRIAFDSDSLSGRHGFFCPGSLPSNKWLEMSR